MSPEPKSSVPAVPFQDVSAPRPAQEAVYVAKLVGRLSRAACAAVLRHNDTTVTDGELLASIYRYARALAALGIGRGSLVALLAPNHPAALAVRYAANIIGAATTYLSVPASAGARAELLLHTAPDLLVVFPETAGLIPAGARVKIATVGEGIPTGALRLDELAAGRVAEPVACTARLNDIGVVVSSGGSTGVPKGSWRTFAAYTAMVDIPSPTDRRQLVNGRLAYLSQVLIDITLLGGGSVVLRSGFDPADTLDAVERERATDLFLIEPQLFELMDHPDVARRDLSSLRSLTHIGASAPPTLRRRARARLGPIVAHTYGASEMGLVSVLPPAGHIASGAESDSSAGHILPGVEVRFRREDGSFADPEEGGSIEVRSAAMAGGYLNRPDLEAAAFREGWYRSGDLGRIDSAGRLHILGRVSDAVVVDGRILTPTMIEDILYQEASVRYAVVVCDEDAGTWIAAAEAWPGTAIDADDCRQAVVPAFGLEAGTRLCVAPVPRVPRTEQGKPDREAIRSLGRKDRLTLGSRGPAPS
ncbi:AMP-binding protein [Methylobacterium frigidaeris]|uniref:2-succinylbenzoate--CoA ligase n=1 Tax=Methylobacterium frigidaeris TaxID=2038277 RepID=A0AA37HJM9_9HYPH|nr:AMP-binding protein [Methylobacterium frigidaeris]GJD66829.1 2-succinylbenzoate--CoA ligase [Methylobacterium frigidaeris]